MKQLFQEDQIAVQLYTVRNYLGSTNEIAETLKKIRAIGYGAVETVGFLGPQGAECWRMLDDSGLICCSAHEVFEDIEARPDEIIEKMNQLGCKYVVSANPFKVDFESASSVKTFTKTLNKIGKLYKEAGLTLLYHNHNMEFARVNGAMNWLDYIYNETDPEYVKSQLDIYWIQLGGGNPESWCKKMKGRLLAIHLKDFGVAGGTLENPIKNPVCKELGEGNLELKPIIEAAEASGCRWYIVEIHDNWVDSDPFKSIEICFSYLKKNFC